MKKFLSLTLIALTVFTATACSSSVSDIELDKAKVLTDFSAVYRVKNESNLIEYDNAYTVSTADGIMNISSYTELPYTQKDENGEEVTLGTQTIKTEQKVIYTDTSNATFGMPVFSSQEFTNSAMANQYTSFTFEHDHALSSGLIKTRKYSESEDSGYSEKLYSVKLKKQYFDKDALPFIMSSFPLSGGVIWLSSGNRDSLQAVKYEFEGTEDISTDLGKFTCNRFLLRPNTSFTSSKAYMWIDAESGLPIKVESASSVMILASIGD